MQTRKDTIIHTLTARACGSAKKMRKVEQNNLKEQEQVAKAQEELQKPGTAAVAGTPSIEEETSKLEDQFKKKQEEEVGAAARRWCRRRHLASTV